MRCRNTKGGIYEIAVFTRVADDFQFTIDGDDFKNKVPIGELEDFYMQPAKKGELINRRKVFLRKRLTMNHVIEKIITRRSIRAFRDDQISEEDLNTIRVFQV